MQIAREKSPAPASQPSTVNAMFIGASVKLSRPCPARTRRRTSFQSPLSPHHRTAYFVLVYGDSITEGVRVNGDNDIPNDTNRNDSTLDYSDKLGELLNAEIGVVGFGATGMTASGSGNVPPLPSAYNLLWSGQPRAFSPVPDLVIYNEGSNKPNAAFSAMQTAFDAVIHGIGYTGTANTHAGLNGTRHLILRPFGGYQAAHLEAIAGSFRSANVLYGDTTGFWPTADSSDGLHPYGYAHLGQIAPRVGALALPLLRP